MAGDDGPWSAPFNPSSLARSARPLADPKGLAPSALDRAGASGITIGTETKSAVAAGEALAGDLTPNPANDDGSTGALEPASSPPLSAGGFVGESTIRKPGALSALLGGILFAAPLLKAKRDPVAGVEGDPNPEALNPPPAGLGLNPLPPVPFPAATAGDDPNPPNPVLLFPKPEKPFLGVANEPPSVAPVVVNEAAAVDAGLPNEKDPAGVSACAGLGSRS